jgi:predicted nuclease with TOPRIM domain
MVPLLGMVTTTPKPEQNTNTHTPMKNKDGLLHKLATATAALYHNALHAIDDQYVSWPQADPKWTHANITAMSEALPRALRHVMPDGYPTRAHLRSHLSTQATPNSNGLHHYITGFDDLYEDVKLAIDAARHDIPAGAHKAYNELLTDMKRVEEVLDSTSKSLQSAIIERDSAKAMIDARTSQRDELEKQLAAADEKIDRLTAELNAANQRISELERGCEVAADMWQPAISRLMRELDSERMVVDVQGRIIASIATICGMTEGNGEELIQKIVTAKGVGEKLKGEVGMLQKRIDQMVAEEHKRGLEFQSHSDQQRGEIAALRGEKIRLIESAASIKSGVKKILNEFGLESPTDDIMDMVRAACESGQRDAKEEDRSCEQVDYRSTRPIHTGGHAHWESHRESRAFEGLGVNARNNAPLNYESIPNRIYGAVPRVAGEELQTMARPEALKSDRKGCCWPMVIILGICLIGPPIVLVIGKLIGA